MSVDFVELAGRAKDDIEVPWDELRSARARRGLNEAVERERRARWAEDELKLRQFESRLSGSLRKRRRALAATIVAAAALLLLWSRGLWSVSHPSDSEQAESAPGRQTFARAELKLKDGSRSLLGAEAQLEVVEEAPERIVLRQREGRVRYQVVPNSRRRFVVRCRGVVVTVLGTVFDVRVEVGMVSVSVQRGKVQVEHRGKTTRLGAGKRVAIATGERSGGSEAAGKTEVRGSDNGPAAAEEARARSAKNKDGSALQAAKNGARPAVQNEALGKKTPATDVLATSPEKLLARADAARSRGDVPAARAVLQRFIATYPRDGRIVTVRYSLARLLRARGQHRAAAQQFEACGRGLRGDALAEAAYSWQLAGQASRSARVARRYLRSFPSGVHAERMRQLSQTK